MEPEIDDLLERFDERVEIKKQPNDLSSYKAHPRFASLYKNCDSFKLKQQQRRNEILTNQKSKRDQLLAKLRSFVTEVNGDNFKKVISVSKGTSSDNDSISDDHKNWNESSNDSSESSQTSQRQSRHKTNIANDLKRFRNKIMLSEWLLDRPMDFESDWMLKLVPTGKRCLVISSNGQTVAYSRTGRFLICFSSHLPGGSPSNCHQSEPLQQYKKQSSIVDCIYVESVKTFYLLDIVSWNSLNLYESEAQFRFFWLKSKYEELGDKLTKINAKNQYKFYMIDSYLANDEHIRDSLKEGLDTLTIGDSLLKLDGLLFFHRQGPYVPGTSPLVLWLKPHMIERVLGLEIK